MTGGGGVVVVRGGSVSPEENQDIQQGSLEELPSELGPGGIGLGQAEKEPLEH